MPVIEGWGLRKAGSGKVEGVYGEECGWRE